MRDRQRALAVGGNSVIEGRDIGSVVAPQAEVKVFLLADADERARRRTSERPGVAADDLAADLRKRDERDAINTQPADDAVLLDTTELTVDEVVERIAELVGRRRSESDGRDLGGRPGDDRDGDQVRRAAARVWRRARAAGRWPGRRVATTSAGSTRRRSAPRSREPCTSWRRSRRTASRPWPAHALVRRVLRSPRRVRSRRRAHDARDRAVGACARALRRGDAPALRRAWSRAARRGDGRDQRRSTGHLRCDLRLPRVASRELQAGVGRMGEPADVRGSPARWQGVQGGVGRDRARDQEALGVACGCPRARGDHATRLRPHDRRSRRRRDRRHRRDRRLSERREVDADQPPDCDARHRRARDTRESPATAKSFSANGRERRSASSTLAESIAPTPGRSARRSERKRVRRSKKPTSSSSSSMRRRV